MNDLLWFFNSTPPPVVHLPTTMTLTFDEPLVLHVTPVSNLPVLVANVRPDFVFSLVQFPDVELP